MGTRLVGHAIVLVRGNVGEELLIVGAAMLYDVVCCDNVVQAMYA
jgi:hypothetical protein